MMCLSVLGSGPSITANKWWVNFKKVNSILWNVKLTVSDAVGEVGVGNRFLEEVQHRLEKGGPLR